MAARFFRLFFLPLYNADMENTADQQSPTAGKWKEFLLFFMAASLILALCSLPVWAGRASQTDELSFIGQVRETADYAVHIATMRLGMHGEWLYRIRFTAEEHAPQAMKLFYVALGHLSQWLRLAPETTYHLSRWVLGYTTLYTAWLLCKRIFHEKGTIWSAFLLIALGGGLGFLQLVLSGGQTYPADYWLIDAYVYLSIAAFPHFLFQLTLILLSLLFFLRFIETSRWYFIALIVAASLLVQFVNPISLFVMDIAFAAWVLLRCVYSRQKHWNLWAALGVLAVTQLPLLTYNAVTLTQAPVWSEFTSQNITLSPPPLQYLWGFAPFWLLAPFGVVYAIRQKDWRMLGLLAWAAAAFIFAYLPTGIQRRFLLGITIPLGILAAQGFSFVLQYGAQKWKFVRAHRGSLILLFFFAACFSAIHSNLGSMLSLQVNPEQFYYPAAYDDAFAWLDENADFNDVLLSDPYTGQLAAQKADIAVTIGHAMETLRYEEKYFEVIRLYENNLPAADLSAMPVDWVIVGPHERALNPQFLPGNNLLLQYDARGVQIYQAVK